jgi:hypothetical protein
VAGTFAGEGVEAVRFDVTGGTGTDLLSLLDGVGLDRPGTPGRGNAPPVRRGSTGTYHVAVRDPVTLFEFGGRVADRLGADGMGRAILAGRPLPGGDPPHGDAPRRLET